MPKETDHRKEASFVLIPGAGGMAWYWHRVAPLLEQAHHEAIAVDLPGDDGTVGLGEYADIVIRAIGERPNVVLAAQSLGGFTARLVCARRAVKMLVLVNAMIPRPGETAGAWWGNSRAGAARVDAARAGGYSAEFDLGTYLLHDVPDSVLRNGPPRQRDQAESIFSEPCRFDSWPQIPIKVIASADDRFFPVEFQRRVARERLRTEVEVIPGGHLVALSNPEGLADCLLRLWRNAP